MGLALYEAAERYLQKVMNGRTGLPIQAWREEKETLAKERRSLCGSYVHLKDEVLEAESVKYSVAKLLADEFEVKQGSEREKVQRREQDWER